jgi:hypothetical protein
MRAALGQLATLESERRVLGGKAVIEVWMLDLASSR